MSKQDFADPFPDRESVGTDRFFSDFSFLVIESVVS